MKKINLSEKFSSFNEHWSPKIVAELNGQHVKVAKLLGEFEWHKHDHEDELFWIIQGTMRMHLRDKIVELSAGELFVVPKGVEHKPEAVEEVHVVMFEQAGTVNTGGNESERTVDKLERI